jgi:hypothetical protein
MAAARSPWEAEGSAGRVNLTLDPSIVAMFDNLQRDTTNKIMSSLAFVALPRQCAGSIRVSGRRQPLRVAPDGIADKTV